MPDPAALPQEVWKNSVLPQMAFYYKWRDASKYEYANQSFYKKKGSIPMNDKTWALIEQYYVDNSPTDIDLRPFENIPNQDKFEEIVLTDVCQLPAITALQIQKDGAINCACNNALLQINTPSFQPDTLININRAAITQIKQKSSAELYLLDAGRLGPHNQPLGALKIFDKTTNEIATIKNKLYRPVYLNQQGSELLISEYGNDVGQLSILDESTNTTETIMNLPGCYRTYLTDLDRDGQNEILAQFSQAREGVYAFTPKENGTYAAENLINFSSVFGFSDLDTADINGDGYLDLVITNGDNADFSNVPKKYHGLHIYLNDQKGNFSESYFYPIYGATQVRCLDVEGDGKTDILVASFFPNYIENSLLLFNNQSDKELSFMPTKFSNGSKGRWMVMEDGDIDQDGDLDVVLGSFISGPTHLKGSVLDKWIKESVDLLILRNKEMKSEEQ